MDLFDREESPTEQALSVFDLTTQIKDTLEGQFSSVWVSGELSNVARPQSGHVYLTLKDSRAQIRGVIWRNTASRLPFDLDDGLEVVCQGTIDVYPPRGSYQLVIRQIEPRGIGALELALRKLRERLGAEGLFEPEHKRPLPPFPRHIAFVTSPTGAAIHDFLQVAKRRWQGARITIIPSRVQGDGASREIAAGIELANRMADRPDVLVVGRGGGSLEDLWCFNEEVVVRAIFASALPVVSAVGHEIDVTLSDLVADVRALTPSEAAELVVPSRDAIGASLDDLSRRMNQLLDTRIIHCRTTLDRIADRRIFRRPLDQIHDLARGVDELEQRAANGVRNVLSDARHRATNLAGRLENLSPLATLSRGYSLTQQTADGTIVRDASAVEVGSQVTTRLGRGEIVSRVEGVRENNHECYVTTEN